MPPYIRLGSIPPKRHTQLRREPGFLGEGIHYEEVITTAGFGRGYSIAYHLRPPTRVKKVEAAGALSVETVREPALRHHHLKTAQLKKQGDAVSGRVPLLANSDVVISRCRPAQRQAELYRNADADEVIFVHQGKGTLHTMLGLVPFRPYDYVVIPRCTTYRLEFDAGAEPNLLIVEATDTLNIPTEIPAGTSTASYASELPTANATCTARAT